MSVGQWDLPSRASTTLILSQTWVRPWCTSWSGHNVEPIMLQGLIRPVVVASTKPYAI